MHAYWLVLAIRTCMYSLNLELLSYALDFKYAHRKHSNKPDYFTSVKFKLSLNVFNGSASNNSLRLNIFILKQNRERHILSFNISFVLRFFSCFSGSIWVYPNYGKRFDDDFTPCTGNVTTNCTEDCDENLMKFAFAMVTIDWIFVGLSILAFACSLCKFGQNRVSENYVSYCVWRVYTLRIQLT